MCFGMPWLENFLIWLVMVVLIIAILQLVMRFIVPRMGLAGEVAALIGTIIWWIIVAVIVIACIKLAFDVFYCMGPTFPRMR